MSAHHVDDDEHEDGERGRAIDLAGAASPLADYDERRTPGKIILTRKCHLQTRVFAPDESFYLITAFPMYRWVSSAFVS